MTDDPKTALRALLSERRRSLAPELLAERSRAAAALLAARPEWRAARVVALYASLKREVDTAPLFLAASESGKRVVFPRVCEGSRQLSFVAVRSLAELTLRGASKISEPEGPAVPLHEIDLLVVPGVAFDSRGERLGRGGGYYDVTLAAARPDAARIGLCLELQLVESIPVGPHDQRMSLVVTESRVIAVSR